MKSALKILPSLYSTSDSTPESAWATLSEVSVTLATSKHLPYVRQIIALIALSAKERGTGRGKRSVSEISQKIRQGQAVIALTNSGRLAGFCYVASYENGAFFANSALIVAHEFRGCGLSRQIKFEAFQLGKKLFPNATPITITTSAAVMKLNQELGYKAVSFADITTDDQFWDGCKGCVNFDILQRLERKNCLCTAMRGEPTPLADVVLLSKPAYYKAR